MGVKGAGVESVGEEKVGGERMIAKFWSRGTSSQRLSGAPADFDVASERKRSVEQFTTATENSRIWGFVGQSVVALVLPFSHMFLEGSIIEGT